MATSQGDELDLVDIAVLLNYEKCIASPHFRHTKLREVCRPGQEVQTVKLANKPWTDDSRPRTVVVLDRGDGETDKEVARILTSGGSPTQDPPQLMWPLATTMTDPLNDIGTRGLETIYYQVQAHDGCFMSVALLQHFFDLFPADTPLRIRHGAVRHGGGVLLLPPDASFTTAIGRRRILEMTLVEPRHTNVIVVFPEGVTHVNGEGATMVHAVMGFSRHGVDEISSVLDLSSMQFGDAGRGPGARGRALFALDTLDEFFDRMEAVAEGEIDEEKRTSVRVGPCPDDDWLREVARKVKDRWGRRAVERWCGHCGLALPKPKACARCQKAWYCTVDHQKMAWPFHRHYCSM